MQDNERSASDVLTSVAVLVPGAQEAAVALQVMRDNSIAPIAVADLGSLATLIHRQIGAVVVAEDALGGCGADDLGAALVNQPSWSDVPVIVLANGAVPDRSAQTSQRLEVFDTAVLLSRPLHPEELIRAVRSALTARRAQHEARRRLEELEHRERQLYESEAKFHAIANSVDQMIWSTLPDGHHDYFNARWYEFTGVPEGSTDGAAWNGLFHPDDQAEARTRWQHSLETGDPYEIEYRLRHRTGAFRWVLGRAQPVLARDGTIVRWYGTCTDIHDLKVAAEQRQLMLGEMNHRVKNTLSMVNVMVAQTLRQAETLAEAQVSIQARIGMMAQAHDRLIRAAWDKTRIVEVVDAALAPHRTGEQRFSITGPDVQIGSKQALALTMALHELSTNASKYGALSAQGGKVDIRWRVVRSVEPAAFEFGWVESDGPPVVRPESKGFGSRMIQQALPAYFNGMATLDYAPGGVVFSLVTPLTGLTL